MVRSLLTSLQTKRIRDTQWIGKRHHAHHYRQTVGERMPSDKRAACAFRVTRTAVAYLCAKTPLPGRNLSLATYVSLANGQGDARTTLGRSYYVWPPYWQ